MIDGLYPGGEERLTNFNVLPVVKTCYATDELNEAVQIGHQVCVLQIKESRDLKLKGLLLRNRLSGEYRLVSDRTMFVQYGNVIEYPDEEWETIHEVKGYAPSYRLERFQNQGFGSYPRLYGPYSWTRRR